MPSRALWLAVAVTEHDGLAVLHERGAAGLLGHAPDLDGQRSTVKVDFDLCDAFDTLPAA